MWWWFHPYLRTRDIARVANEKVACTQSSPRTKKYHAKRETSSVRHVDFPVRTERHDLYEADQTRCHQITQTAPSPPCAEMGLSFSPFIIWFIDQNFQKFFPNTFSAPSDEPLMYTAPLPIIGRQVTPGRSIPPSEHGKIITADRFAAEGERVSLSIHPEEGVCPLQPDCHGRRWEGAHRAGEGPGEVFLYHAQPAGEGTCGI